MLMSNPPDVEGIQQSPDDARRFQITPRAISAHAYVNAAIVLPFDGATATVCERPTLLFGGISAQFVSSRRGQTEQSPSPSAQFVSSRRGHRQNRAPPPPAGSS